MLQGNNDRGAFFEKTASITPGKLLIKRTAKQQGGNFIDKSLTISAVSEKILIPSRKMFVNHSLKQVTAKIVYYGPGLSGKTTNLQYIFSVTNPKTRGELVSIETEIERTLFFDLLPLNVGSVKGYQTKIQLYTVPGQIFYDSTRKLVLKGADGIVFVVDSQELREQAGLESFENLKANLAAYNIDIKELPLVYQFNKRDLDSISSVERLKRVFNIVDCSYFEAVATNGAGVIETLKEISSLTLKKVIKLIDRIDKEMGKGVEFDGERTRPINIGKNFVIDFDTNERQEIKKFEELPVRKIPMEEIESFSEQLTRGQEEVLDRGDMDDKGYDTVMADEAVINLPDEEEDVFTLGADSIIKAETAKVDEIFSRNEFDTMIEDEDKDKEKTGDSIDMKFPFSSLPEEDLDDNMPPPPVKDNIEPVPARPPLKKDLPKHDEYATIVMKEDEFSFENLQEKDLLDLGELAEPVKELEPEPEPASGTEPVKNKEEKFEYEFDLSKTKVFDVLKKFEDQTRIAVIRKITLNEPQLSVDIKDRKGNILESLELYINPEIKKVTIILDIKK